MSETQEPTVGAILRTHRLARGLSIAAIAATTRIRGAYLEAIEADRFEGFPGEAYLLGFLKVFAETVGADAEVVVERYRQQRGIGETEPVPLVALEALAPAASGAAAARSRFGSLALALLLVGLTLTFGYLGIDRWLGGKGDEVQTGAEAVAVAPEPLPQTQAPSPTLVELEPAVPDLPPAPVVETAEEALPDDLGAAYLTLPEKGGILRLKAFDGVLAEVQLDAFPVRQYTLVKDAMLSWKIGSSLQLQVADPNLVTVWFDDQPFDLQGAAKLLVQPTRAAVAEPER